MKFAQGTPKEEADRLVAEWLSGIKQPGNGKGKGNLQSGGLNWDVGANWDFGAHGQAGFGKADFEEMRKRGHSDDHIRNAINEARNRGLNVGRRVKEWESGGSPSLSGGMRGTIASELQRGSWGNAIAAGLRDPRKRVFGK